MNPPLPRLMLMFLALAVASFCFSCGPDDDAWASEDSPGANGALNDGREAAAEASQGIESSDGIDGVDGCEEAPADLEAHGEDVD